MKIKAEQKENKLIKSPNKFLKITKNDYVEIQQIYGIFGFDHSEGSVIGKHNTTILSFLIKEKEGVYKTMISKLSWLCHMSARTLKENYLSGIESFGIIQTFTNEFGVLKWKWIGIEALRNNGSE